MAGPRGWLAIDPKGVAGERTYEVANLLHNPCADLALDGERNRRVARLYGESLDLDPDRILRFALAHAGLSAAWDMEDGENPSFSLTCAAHLAEIAAG